MPLKKLFLISSAVVFVFSLFISCGQKAEDITYTTKSPEAKRLFLQGLDKFDFVIWDEAQVLFGKAVEADPEFAMAYCYWSWTATTTADGLDRLNKAVELVENVSEPEKLIIMSTKAVNEDNAGLAIELLEQMVSLLPEGKRAHYMLGLFYNYIQQNWISAETEYQRVIEIDPEFAPAYNGLGYIFSHQNRYQEAIDALKKYSELKPEEPNPHDSMAEIYLWMGDHENSIKEYSNSLKLDPNFVLSIAGIGHNHIFIGEFDKARAKYDEIPEHARSVADTNTAYYWKAVSYLHENKHDKAIEISKDQLNFNQTRNDIFWQATLHGQLATIYYEKGDFKKALSEAAKQRELAMRPEMAPGVREENIRNCAYAEALILTRQNKQELAKARIEEFEKSAEASKNPLLMKYYHGLLGIRAYWNKDYQTAIDELKQDYPLNQYSKYYLGLCYEKTGQEQEAKNMFSEIAGFNRNGIFYAFIRPAATKKM